MSEEGLATGVATEFVDEVARSEPEKVGDRRSRAPRGSSARPVVRAAQVGGTRSSSQSHRSHRAVEGRRRADGALTPSAGELLEEERLSQRLRSGHGATRRRPSTAPRRARALGAAAARQRRCPPARRPRRSGRPHLRPRRGADRDLGEQRLSPSSIDGACMSWSGNQIARSAAVCSSQSTYSG